MCYSAQVWEQYQKYVKTFGADVDVHAFHKLYVERAHGSAAKIPKGMDLAFSKTADDPLLREIAGLIAEHDGREIRHYEQLMFAQSKRLADARRKLESRETRRALEDVRIASRKIEWAKRKLAALRRTAPMPEDSRIFPGVYAPVLVVVDGRKCIIPMRYQCRPNGKPATYDRKYPGTYNARRDNLEGYWGGLFGRQHGLIVAERFYENVETADGANAVLEFEPRDGSLMHIACVWSHWTNAEGDELYSFAAITDTPEPEVAAAGHDRTVINIKPENVDAWLNPAAGNLAALYAILDDRAHPYYEHRLAA